MDPAELEFIGENEPIGIIPNFSLDNAVHLISGSVGPFRAGLPVHGNYNFVFQINSISNLNQLLPSNIFSAIMVSDTFT